MGSAVLRPVLVRKLILFSITTLIIMASVLTKWCLARLILVTCRRLLWTISRHTRCTLMSSSVRQSEHAKICRSKQLVRPSMICNAIRLLVHAKDVKLRFANERQIQTLVWLRLCVDQRRHAIYIRFALSICIFVFVFLLFLSCLLWFNLFLFFLSFF